MNNVVLVTGATGLVGRHLVARLLGEGQRVRVLTRKPEALLPDWRHAVEVTAGTVTDARSLAVATRGARMVHHLAAEFENTNLLYDTNVVGTRLLLEACSASDVSAIVHYSSIAVYGPERPGVVDEATHCRPKSLYARTKFEAEQLARSFSRRTGIPLVILRSSKVIGEGQGNLTSLLRALNRGRFWLVGRGAVANYVYAGDVAYAGATLAGRAERGEQTLIVSEPMLMDQFVHLIADELGVRVPSLRVPRPVAVTAAVFCEILGRLTHASMPLTLRQVRGLTTRCLYTAERLGRLGVRPQTGLEEGIRRTVEWHREEGLLGTTLKMGKAVKTELRHLVK